MKLRIRGDSLRLRVGQSEVATLARDGFLQDSISFGGVNQLSYRLESSANSKITSEFSEKLIRVKIPESKLSSWLQSEEVGLTENNASGDPHRPLKILVEKDFVCLKPRAGEEDSDGFPHPQQSTDEAVECD